MPPLVREYKAVGAVRHVLVDAKPENGANAPLLLPDSLTRLFGHDMGPVLARLMPIFAG